MNNTPMLAIVIVSWNVRDLLRRCLLATEESLAGSGIPYRIVVADNQSGDGTPAMLRAEFPQVALIETGANLGFAGGNNAALRALGLAARHTESAGSWDGRTRGSAPRPIERNDGGEPPGGQGERGTGGEGEDRPSPPTYLLLLNPDAEPVGDAIPQLVRFLEGHPAIDVVGPQLRYPDGSVQPSRRRFPARATLFWESTPLERLWPNNPWARAYRYDDLPADAAQPVGWLVGAALLVRAAAIRRAGLLDERFFMYSEELEWQARMQAARTLSGSDQRPKTKDQRWEPGRWSFVLGQPHDGISSRGARHAQSRIWYLPAAVITHHEGKSSEQAIVGRHRDFQRSRLLLARSWFGWGFAALLRAFIRLCYGYELLVEAAKLLLGHRPELRRQRIAVYRQVLREI